MQIKNKPKLTKSQKYNKATKMRMDIAIEPWMIKMIDREAAEMERPVPAAAEKVWRVWGVAWPFPQLQVLLESARVRSPIINWLSDAWLPHSKNSTRQALRTQTEQEHIMREICYIDRVLNPWIIIKYSAKYN